jgi:hypothetical protein
MYYCYPRIPMARCCKCYNVMTRRDIIRTYKIEDDYYRDISFQCTQCKNVEIHTEYLPPIISIN